MTDLRHFFLVGCPRSGTTMLQQALNRHSRIVIPPETKLFFSFLGHCRKCQLRHLRRLNSDLGIELHAPEKCVASKSAARKFFFEMARQYLARLGRTDAVSFGEKTPEHTSFIDRIKRFFPKAKLVLIYRDGRDVALSMTKVPWMHSDLVVSFCVWLYYSHYHLKASRDRSLNMYCVKYEHLVLNPAGELRNLLEFLGLPYESAVAEGCGNREGIPEREYTWKARAMQKISADRVECWRKELSEPDVRVLERLGGKTLRSLGYELLTDGKAVLPLSILPRLACNLLSFLRRLPLRSVVNQIFDGSFCLH
ncbi:MAG: sulfotransferase [Gemmataceae bacterium]|nr:sulfotransferase [Gemmataceae bacterium]